MVAWATHFTHPPTHPFTTQNTELAKEEEKGAAANGGQAGETGKEGGGEGAKAAAAGAPKKPVNNNVAIKKGTFMVGFRPRVWWHARVLFRANGTGNGKSDRTHAPPGESGGGWARGGWEGALASCAQPCWGGLRRALEFGGPRG